MSRIIIKKAITTEKSHKNQDRSIWTFQVAGDANKHEIKDAIEMLFDVKVATINTSNQRAKIRQIGKSRIHTKRKPNKIARVSLKDKKAKIDLTKIKK
ncbi:MAG: 50S ribosomal protein L23 [Candidatus Gracilibacteria bacterium]|nr:50S ribosomal protein L23 [bacterium]MDZ4217066.1 50S ribosomal protein L23 [Candidatus Gracilibacteria bacterium]